MKKYLKRKKRQGNSWELLGVTSSISLSYFVSKLINGIAIKMYLDSAVLSWK